jgi:hypothetical protein
MGRATWPVGWDRDPGGVFSGRALRAQPRDNGTNGRRCEPHLCFTEGKVTRVAASERGQRKSFKTPRYGGKVKRVSTKGSLVRRFQPMRIIENGKITRIGFEEVKTTRKMSKLKTFNICAGAEVMHESFRLRRPAFV